MHVLPCREIFYLARKSVLWELEGLAVVNAFKHLRICKVDPVVDKVDFLQFVFKKTGFLLVPDANQIWGGKRVEKEIS